MNDKIEKITYDEIINIVEERQKKVSNILFVSSIVVAIVLFILLIFVLNDDGSILVKLLIPIIFIVIGIMSKLYYGNVIKNVEKNLSIYQSEINSNNVCYKQKYLNVINLYTDYHLFQIKSNFKVIVVAFNEILKVNDKEDYNDGVKLNLTIIELTNGKKIVLNDLPVEIKKSLAKYYDEKVIANESNFEDELIFTHNKYGKIEYELEENVQSYQDSVYIKFMLDNHNIWFYFPKEKINEVTGNDDIKRKMVDKYDVAIDKNFLNIKEKFINQEYDNIMNWWKDSPSDIEDCPIYTGNKTREMFIKDLMNYDNFYVESVSFDNNYNIKKINYGMNFPKDNCDFTFRVFFDLEKNELDFDVAS